MGTPGEARAERIWRCLHCHGPLTPDAAGLRCPRCGMRYPAIAGVPLLVAEPAGYLRAERASLSWASRDAGQRRDWLDGTGRDAGLPDVMRDRYRDVLDAEIAQAEAFLALLEPTEAALEALAEDREKSPGARRAGWNFETLIPYLLRDWTNTSELQVVSSRLAGALKEAFPDPCGKSVAFAGCGAGGLLAEIAPGFARVLGFDLSLPMLAAARHLLDGKSLDLALPRAMNGLGRVSLRKRDPTANAHAEVLAMDALDTAFADGSIDCVITVFLTDIMAHPRRLADEIHRVLSADGVWINYGPSGSLKSLWRFDQTEATAFFAAAGFTVSQAEAYRTTNLDISRDYPSESARSLMCYLTWGRKTAQGAEISRLATPDTARLAEIIPQHFPDARLTHRLGAEEPRQILFAHERAPGRGESFEIGRRAARIIGLVDGTRTVRDIAELLQRSTPAQPADETLRAFARYFDQELLSWREPG